MRCDTAAPIVRKVVSGFQRALGTQRNIARKIESALPDLPVYTRVLEPVLEADARSKALRDILHKRLNGILGKFHATDTEGILAHAMSPETASAVGFTNPKHAKAAEAFSDFMVETLSHVGMTPEQATRFLRKDLPKLREVGGDVSRLDPNNLRPASFRGLLDEIDLGSLRVNQNNAYALGWDLINAVSRVRHVRPAVAEARKLSASWQGLKTVSKQDITTAREFTDDFVNARLSNSDQIVQNASYLMRGLLDHLGEQGKIPGAKRLAASKILDDDTIIRMVDNATSYFGGFAMAFNPALVMRQLMQPVLGGMKVGWSTMGEGFKKAYARGEVGEAFRRKAASALNIPLEAGAPVMLVESGESLIASRTGRAVLKAQQAGLLPYRWGDKMNRFAAFGMGESAIERHAPKLLEGKLSWEEFLFETGLKGSPTVEQSKIQALLLGETPNVGKAATEYGKILAADTQFLYTQANAPMMFRGTIGRMAGQFGMFPVSFAEYMLENTVGARDARWVTRFGTRWAALQLGLIGLSKSTGVDTSTWLFSNPLTFEGGPWFQTFRDVSTLGVSTNEFERREATAKLRKVFGNSTAGFMGGVFNPFGGQTTNLFQAMAEEDPTSAMLLGLGFNLTDPSLATRRRR